MGMKTALSGTGWMTFAVLAAAIWLAVTWFSVFESLNWSALNDPVGSSGIGGVAGLIVLALILGLLVVFYGTLSEGETTVETFPPE